MIVADRLASHHLAALWQSLTIESCPRHYNFHMHSLCSDGQLHPYEILCQARTIGLKGFAITDHHCVDAYLELQAMLEPNDPVLWSGIEINGILDNTEVHILGYGFEPQHAELRPFTSGSSVINAPAEVVVEAIQVAGGLAVLAHPFRYGRDPHSLVAAAAIAGFDGLEAYYSYRNPDPWKPCPDRTPVALELATRYGLLVTCGTDSHGSSLLRRV